MTEIILLLAVVFLPIFIPILIIVPLLGNGSCFERLKSSITLDEESGLSKQGLLWLSILSPIFYFIFLGAVSWCGYKISLTSKGLEVFLSISVFPLGFLSLIIPLSVFVSRLHATKQTAKQIEITQQKNNIDLFHSHRKELFSYFSQIGEIEYLDCLIGKYKIHPKVHKIFFIGKPEDGTPIANEAEFKKIEQKISNAQLFLDSIIKDTNPSQTYNFYINTFCSEIYRLSMILGLPEINVDLAQKSILVPTYLDNQEEKQLLTVGTTTDEAIAAYRYIKSYFTNLCDFAGREMINIGYEDEELKYIDTGVKFRTVKEEKTIERLCSGQPI